MQIPKLLFHHHHDDEKVIEVHPDKNHVYEGDFDDHQISSDQQSPEDDFTSVLSNPWSQPGPVRRSSEDIPNLESVNEEIDRNICSISDIYGNEAGETRDERSSFDPIGSIGRFPDYNDQSADDFNFCSISALQDNNDNNDVFSSDYIAQISPRRRKDNQMPDDILPSIADLQVFDYEVNKDDKRVVGESPRKSSELNTFPLELQSPEEEDTEGLWFGSHANEQVCWIKSTQNKDLISAPRIWGSTQYSF